MKTEEIGLILQTGSSARQHPFLTIGHSSGEIRYPVEVVYCCSSSPIYFLFCFGANLEANEGPCNHCIYSLSLASLKKTNKALYILTVRIHILRFYETSP